jgi:hypothetical protein
VVVPDSPTTTEKVVLFVGPDSISGIQPADDGIVCRLNMTRDQ